MQRLRLMLLSGCRCVVCLDPVGSYQADLVWIEAKAHEVRKRNERRSKMWQSWLDMDWENLTDVEKKENEALRKKYLQGALRITPPLVFQLMRSLRDAGFSYIQSPGEADHQLVHLVQAGVCDYALTIDGDVLAHGVPVIRSFDFSCGSGVVYQLPTENDFLLRGKAAFAWAFMLGCDYTDGVHGIGPVIARVILDACSGDWNPQNLASAILDEVPAVARNREHAGKPVVGRSREELEVGIARLYSSFLEGIVFNLQEKSFTQLDGPCATKYGIDSTDTEGRAQLFALGCLCANTECNCH